MKWKGGSITYIYDEDQCRCKLGLCVEACGQGVLEFDEGKEKMRIGNTVQCIFCRQCEEICPYQAISIEGALTLEDIRTAFV
ncbi:MAG: 4Fe-4S binding protein [Deltaproteobacteria bacterium]|nr:4Fe-4S binding protein [Deltaproteobacteria bacterium]MBW2136678.1 4Fe-4S binding protein [Deltaproteobacteria bacterium]